MTPPEGSSKSNAAAFETNGDDIFGRIATRYDLLCDLFSFGIHRIWKNRVATVITAEPWSNLLDTATGTGDIVLRVAAKLSPGSKQRILASDICPQMLEMAARRLGDDESRFQLEVLDACAMPTIPDTSVDIYSMSLGLKICDRLPALTEAMRVLRPGGRLVVLEASNIRWQWLHEAYLRYMAISMPLIGWIATGGDASAYKYLLKGVREFPTAEQFTSELASIGFIDVSFERLSLGIVAIHTARKPSNA